MNGANDGLPLYSNYGHSMLYNYAQSRAWLIKGLFMDRPEPRFHRMLIDRLKWECGLSFEMTALCICTHSVSRVAIDRRAWAEAVVFDCMQKSTIRNDESKQNTIGQAGRLIPWKEWSLGLCYELYTKISIYQRLWWAAIAGTTPSPTFVLNRLSRQWGCTHVAEIQAWWLYSDWCNSHDKGPHLSPMQPSNKH